MLGLWLSALRGKGLERTILVPERDKPHPKKDNSLVVIGIKIHWLGNE